MGKMSEIERYRIYSVEDFVLDEGFRSAVSGTGDYSLDDLEEYFPERVSDLRLAAAVLRGLHVQKQVTGYKEKRAQWNQVIRRRRTRVLLHVSRYAAVFILLAGIGGVLLKYVQDKRLSIREFAHEQTVSTDDALLVLSGNKQVSIAGDDSKVEYSSDGSGVSLNDSSRLAQSVEGPGFNQMIVPYGKRSSVLLSDGTQVWLNAGSRLVYPPVFRGKSREVYLDGEGYFDVSKNADKPFYVQTDKFKVKVYGTGFNIRAIKEDNEYNTVLVEGKVSMESSEGGLFEKEYILSPSEKGTYLGEGNRFLVEPVRNMEDYIAWVNGYMSFNNEDFGSLLRRLSRYYNIGVECRDAVSQMRVSGKLGLQEDLDHVLNGLCAMSQARYKKEGNTYIFYSK